MIDDDDPLAQLLHIGEVVGSEDDRRAVLTVDRSKRVSERELRHHIETDRRLVKEQQRWAVRERRDKLSAHTLTERQGPHRLTQKLA